MLKIICGIDKSINDPQILESANCITSREDRGVSNRKAEGTAILEIPDISYCLDANYWKGTTPEQYVSKKRRQLIFEQISQRIRIRKLTPRECYRLMGLTFEDCDKATELGVADTHLYKQSGNGIITNCCALLAEHLYKAQYDNTYICTDERYQKKFYKTTGGVNSAVQKDSMVVEKHNLAWLEKKYAEFYEKHGYIPEYFVPYNGTECTDYAPTLTANSNTSPTHAGTVLIAEINKEKRQ